MKELLAAVQQRLIAEVPELKYIDENWGQLDYYSTNMPVQFPCCLIDIANIPWQNLGNKQQSGNAAILITVANIKLTNTSGKAPAQQRQQAWFIHDILQKIHQALHTYRPMATGSLLMRKVTNKVQRDDGVQQYAVVYECAVHGEYEVNTQQVSGLNIEVDVQRPIFPEDIIG